MGRVQLEFPGRLAALLLSGVGVALISLGVGGIQLQQCKLARPEPVEKLAETKRRSLGKAWTPPRLCAPGSEKVELNLGTTYLPIDVVAFLRLPADAVGAVSRFQTRRANRPWAEERRRNEFLPAPLGPDNILLLRSSGILAAFALCLLGMGLSLFVVLATQDLVCETHPNILLVERILVAAASGLHLLGGALALVWGQGYHISQEAMEEAGLSSFWCYGWVIGGALAITAAAIQAVDLILSLALRSPFTVTPPGMGELEAAGLTMHQPLKTYISGASEANQSGKATPQSKVTRKMAANAKTPNSSKLAEEEEEEKELTVTAKSVGLESQSRIPSALLQSRVCTAKSVGLDSKSNMPAKSAAKSFVGTAKSVGLTEAEQPLKQDAEKDYDGTAKSVGLESDA